LWSGSRAASTHKRTPSLPGASRRGAAAMGKAKKGGGGAEVFAFAIDLKSVTQMKPDQRVKWLSKACRAVADGEASVKHLFDVLSNKKLVNDFHEKAGQRMFRILKDNLYLFSEKQQRFLSVESVLAMEYGDKVDKSDEEKGANDRASTGGGDRSGASESSRAPTSSDAASKMEEMMARCRDFVRQNANTFDDRQREAAETERLAREAERKAREDQYKREWQAITDWHVQLEPWETSCMERFDERLPILAALQRREEEARAEAAAAALAAGPPETANSSSQQSSGKEKKSKKKKSADTSDDETAAVLRPDKDRDRDRAGDKDSKDRDRAGAKDRKRKRSRSRSRSRRRRSDKDKAAPNLLAGYGTPVAPMQAPPQQAMPPMMPPLQQQAMPSLQQFDSGDGRRRFREVYDPLAPPQVPPPPPSMQMSAAAKAAAGALNGTLADMLRGAR